MDTSNLKICELNSVIAIKIVDDPISKIFFPTIEKVLSESIKKGLLTGCPLVNAKTTLHDSSYHIVYFSEMSFKMIASLTYKNDINKVDFILF